MRHASFRNLHFRTQGQSIIETALLMPIMLLIAFNAINFGYFFFVAVNLAAAPRAGAQYSIIGFSTPQSAAIPPPGPIGAGCPTSATSTDVYVCSLVFQDIAGVLANSASATVRVCSSMAGTPIGSGSGKHSACQTFGGGTVSGSAAPDPEAPLFILDRVDVQYAVSPIIPAFQLPTPAGPISLTLIPNLNFRRQISMREMN
jgi:hypothetical protein